MIKVLGSPYFLHFIVPLITVIVSIFIKYVTRNDAHKAFKKEDLAVGLDVAATALVIYITDVVGAAVILTKSAVTSIPSDHKIIDAPWVIPFILLGVWGVSTVVRKNGWVADGELSKFWGIVFPNIFGLLVLFYVVSRIS